MKKHLTFLLLIAAIGANAQMTKIKSKSALADSIWLPKGGIEIGAIVATAQGDTVRSFIYVIHVLRDTTGTYDINLRYFDKNGALLSENQQSIPATLFNKWTLLITKLDTYIIAHNKRIVKQ